MGVDGGPNAAEAQTVPEKKSEDFHTPNMNLSVY